jgi:hypothetical protein
VGDCLSALATDTFSVARIADKIEDQYLPGTVVGLRIRTDRPFDFAPAWDQLTAALDNVPALLAQLRYPND